MGKQPRTTPAFDPLTMVHVPDILDTQEWWDLWSLWSQDRIDRKMPLTEAAAKMQIGKMARAAHRYGFEVALEMMEEAMNCGWRGMFLPRRFERLEMEQARLGKQPAPERAPTAADWEGFEG